MSKGSKTVIERSYRANVEDVWSLWTTKPGFESWWGPSGFRADVHKLEARVGGELRYDMVADTPGMIVEMRKQGRPVSHPAQARFTELKLRERVAITSVIDFLPGVPPYENVIAVDIKVEGDRVRMVFTLAPMHSEDFTQMQEQGFLSQLTKLDKRFTQGAATTAS
jgi:uncharacterized protein YndB with AHSA1/START domain